MLGFLKFDTGSLHFEETCNNAASMTIGAASHSQGIHVSYDVLSRLIGSYASSKYITFQSNLGHIDVSNVIQATRLTRASKFLLVRFAYVQCQFLLRYLSDSSVGQQCKECFFC